MRYAGSLCSHSTVTLDLHIEHGVASRDAARRSHRLHPVRALISRQAIFGMPIYKSVLPRLVALRNDIKIDLLLDSLDQLPILESSNTAWDVFIKIDVGARRAGLTTESPLLKDLVQAVEASKLANLIGFYCHANHSYGCRTKEDVVKMLKHEVDEVVAAASLVPNTRTLTVSIGATPTAHVIERLNETLPSNVKLELHAGKRTFLTF